MKSEHYKNANGEQVDFLVKVITRPNLRDEVDAYLAYVGKTYLEDMFDREVIRPEIKDVCFFYPERWANILELRAIPERLTVTFPNLVKAEIVTHSVYVIQCVRAEHLAIYDSSDKYPEQNAKDIKTHYCPPSKAANSLMVFRG